MFPPDTQPGDEVAMLGRTLTMIITWLLDSLKEAGKEDRIELLTTLDHLLRNNAQEMHDLLPLAIVKNGMLLKLLHGEELPNEVTLLVVQYLEACCTPSPAIDPNHLSIQHELCTVVFYKYLQMDRNPNVEEFITVKSLVKALQISENMEDFSEFKHRDHLIEQICLSLGHLATLMTSEDLLPLKDAVAESVLADQMRRTRDRVVPEKAAVLLVARERILSLDAGAARGERMEVHEALQRVFSSAEL